VIFAQGDAADSVFYIQDGKDRTLLRSPRNASFATASLRGL
jgi:hypothetical protein